MRELSAKLTEGEILDSQINVFTNSTEISVYIQIANSHYLQIHGFQFFGPQFILFCLICCILPTPIKFKHQSCFCTIEIHNIISDCLLPLKANGIASQKVIP